MSTELERIALLRHILEGSTQGPAEVQVGIGDDAAVLAPPRDGSALVWTVDAQVEGTHFRLDWMSWEDVGWRSVMAAASDLAAMGASPVGALASLVLGPSVDDAALASLATGQAAAGRVLGLPIVGGNLARGRETSVTTTVLGRATAPLLRDGAREGDLVWVGGPLGEPAAGLACLERGLVERSDLSVAACVEAFKRPRAKVAIGLALAGRAHAAIDVSDGLAGDAAHVARASNVTVVFEEAALRAGVSTALADVSRALGRDPLDFVLAGGEDFAVLAFAPPDVDLRGDGFAGIGRVTPRTTDAHVNLATATGLVPVTTGGFDHFAPPRGGARDGG